MAELILEFDPTVFAFRGVNSPSISSPPQYLAIRTGTHYLLAAGRFPYLHSTGGTSGQGFPLFVGKLPEEQKTCSLGSRRDRYSFYFPPVDHKCQ